jgi:hypothetical protein
MDSHDRVSQEHGLDRDDELRRQAQNLAYRSAWEHVRVLRLIEATLLAAANAGGRSSRQVDDFVLEVIRTHMVRGLIAAQAETGDRATYWVSR